MEKALHQAERMPGSFCLVGGLEAPLLVVETSSRVTDTSLRSSRVVFAVCAVDDELHLLRDWELMRLLRACSLRSDAVSLGNSASEITEWIGSAIAYMESMLPSLKVPFGIPQIKLVALFWPV
jgi:hypothetical protein